MNLEEFRAAGLRAGRVMDTADPEYAARKWLTDCMAEEAETCLDLLDELDLLRARAAELEAGTVHAEWGVQYGPGDVDNYGRKDRDVELARLDAADPSHPGVLVTREIRYGPWTVAATTAEATAWTP